jgi:RHS repeat-associated protein
MTYTYDGDKKRVEKSSGTYYWLSPSGSVLAETDSSGNTQNEYIYFSGGRTARRDSGGNVYYYFQDQIGTSRLIANSSGTVCYDGDYTPFGYEMAYVTTCSQNYKFTGLERDSETGLDQTLHRKYDSSLGRWLTPDRHRGDPSNPQSWNRYAYVLNDPMIFTDPYGLWTFSITGNVGFQILGASAWFSGGLSFDGQGNVSIPETPGGGAQAYGARGLFLGLSVSGSNAQTNQDLSGWFDNILAAGGAGAAPNAAYTWGNSAHGPVKMITVGVAAQTPGAAVIFGPSYTWVTDLFNLGTLFGSSPGSTAVVTSTIITDPAEMAAILAAANGTSSTGGDNSGDSVSGGDEGGGGGGGSGDTVGEGDEGGGGDGGGGGGGGGDDGSDDDKNSN